MAGYRQGLALLHPARGPQKVILFGVGKGRNAVEDGADRGFLVPRGMGAVGVPIAQRWGGKPRGRNFGLHRCSKGQEAQPSAANQSR